MWSFIENSLLQSLSYIEGSRSSVGFHGRLMRVAFSMKVQRRMFVKTKFVGSDVVLSTDFWKYKTYTKVILEFR
jgi:hypothetical protein